MHHLQCEIDQCVGFTSLHKSLTLVDEDEFQLEAPEEITLEAAKSEHDLTLGRLKYELLQRQKLKEKLEQVERNREELHDVANRKRTNLNNIRPHMQTILQGFLKNIPVKTLKCHRFSNEIIFQLQTTFDRN